MKMKLSGILPLCFALTSLVLADDAAPLEASRVDTVLKNANTANAPLWEQISQITALKPQNTDSEVFAEQLLPLAKAEKRSPGERTVLAGALLALGEQKEGTQLLEQIIAQASLPLPQRLGAASLMGGYGGEYASTSLRRLLRETAIDKFPATLQVELAKSLWDLTFDPTAKETLKRFAFQKTDRGAAIAALLALGRIGQYDSNKADDPLRVALRDLAQAPGDTGAEARMLRRLDGTYSKTIARDKFTSELIGEIVEKIRTRYAFDQDNADEAEQATPEKLATNSARALVRSLDDFSDYLDADDYQEMLNSMHGDYGGIGAYVGMRNGFFTVLTPMWGKPAAKAGLRAMDVITKIEGEEIGKLALDKIIKRLKGAPGTKVRVTVIRKGFDEPQEMVINREIINMPMMFFQKLPGDIGYIRLTGFQEDPERRISTSSELKRALLALKKDHVKGVILDLRNNPGGLLTEAVSVCENFIERNQLIVYSKGTFQPRRNYVSKIIGKPTFTGPLVVLINGGSASASEIVSGALRDHKRATLVGEKSFGKGSVQMLLPIETAGNSRLKLTIAKYYLPSGECIHGRDKGIKPHVVAEEPKFTPAERELRIKQMENRDISVWLEENFDKNREAFMGLLEYDEGKTDKYPGFADLRKILNEKYPKLKLDDETIRRELRSNLFAFLRESRGENGYPVDLMESEALQRAIVVLGEKIGGLPDILAYNAFKDKWKNEDNQKAAEARKKEPDGEKTPSDNTSKTGNDAPHPDKK